MADDAYKLRFHGPSGFHIIGEGAIGGKAEGLALLNGLLDSALNLSDDFPDLQIGVPKTLVLAGSAFENFVVHNALAYLSKGDYSDEAVTAEFLKGRMPDEIKASLGKYLAEYAFPLAVRSSGMLEDAHHHAYAGLYRTYMISNDQDDVQQRLANLVRAVKLVYASTFYLGPKAYARRAGHDFDLGRMAVIVQHAVGRAHGGYYYPAISGVAQSHDYYPPVGIKPKDGVATIALGLGKQVVSGERALRFCPRYPKRLLQRSSVEDVLAYAQRRFYALKLKAGHLPDADGRDHVVRRHVSDAEDEPPVRMLAGTYVVSEHRIKETTHIEGPKVLTFSGVLKFDLFPLSGILVRLLDAGEARLDTPVEMEFAVDIAHSPTAPSQFHLLQMRPMTASRACVMVTIDDNEREQALCFTRQALGNTQHQHISDIVYIKPDVFDPAKTRDISREISEVNALFDNLDHQYLLVGPGRWGSADPWLGIPVRWADISNVAAIVETPSEKLNVEPSVGAHFFHNLVSMGISYLSVAGGQTDHFDWHWLVDKQAVHETPFAAHVRLSDPIVLKVDGRTSRGVILYKSS